MTFGEGQWNSGSSCSMWCSRCGIAFKEGNGVPLFHSSFLMSGPPVGWHRAGIGTVELSPYKATTCQRDACPT
eukprot:6945488-Pyramimonas_sp.AAC.2